MNLRGLSSILVFSLLFVFPLKSSHANPQRRILSLFPLETGLREGSYEWSLPLLKAQNALKVMDRRSALQECHEHEGWLPTQSDFQRLIEKANQRNEKVSAYLDQLALGGVTFLWLDEKEPTGDYWATAFHPAERRFSDRFYWDDELPVVCLFRSK